jgi:hypothetical protein
MLFHFVNNNRFAHALMLNTACRILFLRGYKFRFFYIFLNIVPEGLGMALSHYGLLCKVGWEESTDFSYGIFSLTSRGFTCVLSFL